MKQAYLIFTILCILGISANGKQVDELKAARVASNFMSQKVKSGALRTFSSLKVVEKALSKDFQTPDIINESVLYYVFNVDTTGFVIIAGDDVVNPVLGYSTQSDFDALNVPISMQKWLEGYKAEIRYAIQNQTVAVEGVSRNWDALLNGSDNTPGYGSTTRENEESRIVNPLIQTRWDQSPYYNALCPGGSVTGCVATAMAQIMKYWNYPATGSGFHSYDHPVYGTLSVNFAASEYQWNQMPLSVTSPNNAVAKLMYDAGVSVDMYYSPESSGAQILISQSQGSSCSELALKTYFGYKSTLRGVMKDTYSENEWINLLKTELDAGRPVLYGGIGSEGGHCFVADGYDNNNFFHFNWGWSGSSDGYFQINALNPGSLGTGGGSGGFNTYQQAVIGIEPASTGGSTSSDLALYNYVVASPSTVNYGGVINVSTNIANFGQGTFQGDLCAAIFDEAGIFVDYVGILTNLTLESGYAYTDDLQFTYDNSLNVLPGNYGIYIFSKIAGGEWIMVDDNGSYSNYESLTIVNANDIEIYSNITVEGGSVLTKGKAATVSVNITNDGTSTFTGDYQVALFNLDGTWAQTIQIISENNGLPPQYAYVDPIQFSTNAITVDPGTYLLAVRHNPANAGYELSGSSYYQNPVKVTVREAPLEADRYEMNNEPSQAFVVNPDFNNNSANIQTQGSNCHMGTDVDYYKINLQASFDYTIAPRLHDAYNSGNGNTYTLDGLFAYSLNGTDWSEAYDDVMQSVITAHNGGTLYIGVAPYFAGETGTYLLSVNLSRSPAVGIEENDAQTLLVYPNPAKDFITIDARNYGGEITGYQFYTADSRMLINKQLTGNKLATVSLETIPAGVYLLKITTLNNFFTKKIVVK